MDDDGIIPPQPPAKRSTFKIYKNGIAASKPVEVNVCPSNYPTIGELCTSFVTTGAANLGADRLFNLKGERIRQLAQLEDGETYVSAYDDFINADYGQRKKREKSEQRGGGTKAAIRLHAQATDMHERRWAAENKRAKDQTDLFMASPVQRGREEEKARMQLRHKAAQNASSIPHYGKVSPATSQRGGVRSSMAEAKPRREPQPRRAHSAPKPSTRVPRKRADRKPGVPPRSPTRQKRRKTPPPNTRAPAPRRQKKASPTRKVEEVKTSPRKKLPERKPAVPRRSEAAKTKSSFKSPKKVVPVPIKSPKKKKPVRKSPSPKRSSSESRQASRATTRRSSKGSSRRSSSTHSRSMSASASSGSTRGSSRTHSRASSASHKNTSRSNATRKSSRATSRKSKSDSRSASRSSGSGSESSSNSGRSQKTTARSQKTTARSQKSSKSRKSTAKSRKSTAKSTKSRMDTGTSRKTNTTLRASSRDNSSDNSHSRSGSQTRSESGQSGSESDTKSRKSVVASRHRRRDSTPPHASVTRRMPPGRAPTALDTHEEKKSKPRSTESESETDDGTFSDSSGGTRRTGRRQSR